MAPSSVNYLVRLLLNPECAACGGELDRPLDSPVCRRCWQAVVRVRAPCCEICGDVVATHVARHCRRCDDRPPSFSIARSVAVYDGSMREIVHAFKYHRRRALAIPLARLMTEVGSRILEDADAVVPVPLHPWRSLHRGFNQADDLAMYLRRPVWRVLRRRHHGRPQVSLASAARRAGVESAFGLARTVALGLRRQRLCGATVVLIDDVMTTGATLDACGRILLEAGVRTVRALTVARALGARPESPRMPPRISSAPRR